jgi:two-component system, NtrC family, nitrogen regulation sensor histidine kinase NtrY
MVGMFALASMISAAATFLSVSGIGPIAPGSEVMVWLLVLNGLLILTLALAIGRQLGALRQERSQGGGRLHLRLAGQFSLAAVLPALIVALFLGTTITLGLQNWFSDRVSQVVEGAADVARSYVEDASENIRRDMLLMALDLNNAEEGYRTQFELFESYLAGQSSVRKFSAAQLINSEGKVLASSPTSEGLGVPSPEAFRLAQDGDVVLTPDIGEDRFRALFRLSEYQDAYLYVSRDVQPGLLNRLMDAEEALISYREAEAQSVRLQIALAISYLEMAILVLLIAVWLGLRTASRIVEPVTDLSRAANRVRRGDFSPRVTLAGTADELDELGQAFNTMTAQLGTQRNALELARVEAEARRLFIEAVLGGVSAGVLRVDADGRIDIANTSAGRLLLGNTSAQLSGLYLADIAPEFLPIMEMSLARGELRTGEVQTQSDSVFQHLQVKVVPADEGGGAIITFDDMTPLVIAQRQAAWKDVARRIAHEIRNPLTPIQLSAERLKRRFRGKISDDLETFDRCTDTIIRQVGDIGRLVEEFSAFARMPKPILQPVTLNAALESTLFGQRLAFPDVDFALEMDGSSISLTCDERLICQSLTNLLKNAAEASLTHVHKLRLDTPPNVALKVSHGDHWVEMSVEDNGPGFPQNNRERLLEPYVTTRESGMGLGLAIVERVVRDHGGTLILTDRSDGAAGASVIMRLPVNQPGHATPHNRPAVHPDTSPMET